MKKLGVLMTLVLSLAWSANAQWSIENVTPPIMRFANGASALAWGDVNNDGYMDLFVGCSGTEGSHLYLNHRDGWTDAALDYEVYDIQKVKSATLYDYNQDGYLDLLCVTTGLQPIQLYKQLENGRMQLQTLSGNFGTNPQSTSAVWCDVNQDGLSELILNNNPSPETDLIILEQVGNGLSEVRGETPDLSTDAGVLSVIDFDLDGDQDLFTGMRNEDPTRLFEFVEGTYRDASDEMEVFTKMIDRGIVWADFDLDGNLDCFTYGDAQYTGLYYGHPTSDSWRFDNRIDEFGIREMTGFAVDASAVDANNDGWTDLMIIRKNANDSYLLLNNNGEGWSVGWTIPSDFGAPTPHTYSSAWADFDHDGDLDYAIAMGNNGVRLFKNRAPRDNEWVEVYLCGTGTTTPLMDCSILVEFEQGSKLWLTNSMCNSGGGADAGHLFAVNTTDEKSDVIAINIYWQNGAFSKYFVQPREIRTVIMLHQPPLLSIALAPNENAEIVPVELVNSPNPFNPTTNIQFTVPEAGQVHLSVFNLLGQEIAVLVNGYMDSGNHSLTWNASALPSGLYFARLTAAGQTKLNRMLLTK